MTRYGGEEFAILLPDTAKEAAAQILEKMLANVHVLDIPHSAFNVADHITLSVGLVTNKGINRLSQNAFIQLADDALYQAKEKGRNQIVVSP